MLFKYNNELSSKVCEQHKFKLFDPKLESQIKKIKPSLVHYNLSDVNFNENLVDINKIFNELSGKVCEPKDRLFEPKLELQIKKIKKLKSQVKKIKSSFIKYHSSEANFSESLVDINKIFDDIPIGQKIFKYIVFAPELQSQINSIKFKLDLNNLLDVMINEILTDIEAYFDNQEVIFYKFSYILDDKGQKFYDSDEKEKYDDDYKSFLAINNNLGTLGIKYYVNSLIQDKDANGNILISGPVELEKDKLLEFNKEEEDLENLKKENSEKLKKEGLIDKTNLNNIIKYKCML